MKHVKMESKILLVVIFAIGFLVWSCGGGGGGGGSNLSTRTPASMDQATAEDATAMSIVGSGVSSLADGLVDGFVYDRMAGKGTADGVLSLPKWALQKVREAFLAGNVAREQGVSRSGSVSDSDGCISMNGTWVGPDPEDVDDICDISDATLTMRFSNCLEGSMSIDGTMTITINGDMCLPDSISIRFSNFSMIDDAAHIEMNSENFRMAMTALSYDNQSLDELNHVKVTLNGDIAVNSFNLEYYNYIEDMTYTGTTVSIALSGSFTGMCLDGWVTLTTLSPILIEESDTCPVGGRIQFSGTSDIIVEIFSDGRISIGDEMYSSCTELPDACE